MKLLKNSILSALALVTSISMNAFVATPSVAQTAGAPPFQLPRFAANCTRDDRDALLEAHINMGRMVDDALAAVRYEGDSKEYTLTFGAFSRERHKKVQERLYDIRVGLATVPMTANCPKAAEDPACEDGSWAYVTKQNVSAERKKYIINFCEGYFNTTQNEVREISQWSKVAVMQGATFLHELTHFAWSLKGLYAIDGTVDEEYDEEDVLQLAKDNPDKAVINADSYHIFVMKLAVRNRTIFR